MADNAACFFGARLKELREAHRMTQAQLATASGLTANGIAQLEIGRRRPSWETVVALCQALGVPCTAFTEEPTAGEPPRRGRPRKAPEGPETPTPGPD
jgi:transcriptional regulator with XRE-family HTH domain